MFKIGNQEITKLYIGNQEISKVYLGNQLIYTKEGGGSDNTTKKSLEDLTVKNA